MSTPRKIKFSEIRSGQTIKVSFVTTFEGRAVLVGQNPKGETTYVDVATANGSLARLFRLPSSEDPNWYRAQRTITTEVELVEDAPRPDGWYLVDFEPPASERVLWSRDRGWFSNPDDRSCPWPDSMVSNPRRLEVTA